MLRYEKKIVKIQFTIKTLNLNAKIERKIKIVLKLKTKVINRKEIKTTTFPFKILIRMML